MRMIIDHHQVRRNRQRAARLADTDAWYLHERIRDDLIDRLAATTRAFSRCLCIGPNASDIARALRECSGVTEVVTLCEQGFPDDEILPSTDGVFDLVVILNCLHETNDTPGILIQLAKRLQPDGLLLATMMGTGTLAQLRDSLIHAETRLTAGAAARVLPFADIRDTGALLQRCGFALPVSDSDQVVVRYKSPLGLMRDLRAMGATNTLIERSRRPLRRDVLAECMRHYAENHADADGKIRATFNIIWMSGWRPSPDQPKAAKRGSATVSLAEALQDKSGSD